MKGDAGGLSSPCRTDGGGPSSPRRTRSERPSTQGRAQAERLSTQGRGRARAGRWSWAECPAAVGRSGSRWAQASSDRGASSGAASGKSSMVRVAASPQESRAMTTAQASTRAEPRAAQRWSALRSPERQRSPRVARTRARRGAPNARARRCPRTRRARRRHLRLRRHPASADWREGERGRRGRAQALPSAPPPSRRWCSCRFRSLLRRGAPSLRGRDPTEGAPEGGG
jgi:hypothetical protein